MKRLYVAPAHRGAGIGRAIVRTLVDKARALGYRAMLLDTLDSMTAARNLYASAGFVATAAYRHNPLPGAMFWRLPLMPESLDRSLALLERTPAALDALLRDLPSAWTSHDEGPGTWSAYDIVGHLIHGERTEWIARAKMILDAGESKTFEKFDRLAQRRESAGKTLNGLLDEFAQVRRGNLAEVRAMQLAAADLDRRGRHPVFGPVTLGQLLSTWAAHDLTHLHQLSRVMAHQTRDAVGPWSAYLGVLHCHAHGA
jgi:hypothetical protein